MFGVVSVVPGGGGDGGGGGGVDGDKTLCTVCTGIGLSALSTWQSEATMEAIVGATPSSSISELWDMVGTSVNSETW